MFPSKICWDQLPTKAIPLGETKLYKIPMTVATRIMIKAGLMDLEKLLIGII